jgi:hypothetical protein
VSFAQPDHVRARSSQELAESAREILEKQVRVHPRVRFEKMVEAGLIDNEGRLTRDFGGEATRFWTTKPVPLR